MDSRTTLGDGNNLGSVDGLHVFLVLRTCNELHYDPARFRNGTMDRGAGERNPCLRLGGGVKVPLGTPPRGQTNFAKTGSVSVI
jgi:hypothetical protein